MKRFLVLCIAVIACYAAVTGSIAYFTDSVETTNRVASGNLHVVQHEYERKDGVIKTFSQEKPLYPAVGAAKKDMTVTVSGHEVALESGIRNYVDKIVTAENKGSLNMFVRTYIAVPSFSADDDETREGWIHLDVNTTAGWEYSDTPIIFNESIDGHDYDIYMATYQNRVEPNGITPPSLLGFYMDSKVTNNGDGLVFADGSKSYDLGNGNNMKILVASVASQATVFEDADEAMAATYPKDEKGNEVYHPWDNTFFVSTQEQLDAALNTAKTEYDTVISFATTTEGTYTLPAQLPAGLRITGAGAEVKLTIKDNSLSATDVEFDHVEFTNAFTFNGWGSFEEVTFATETKINATHDTVLVDCEERPTISSGENYVSIVPSVPTATPDTTK